MPSDITRRDFLNGTALAIAAGLSPIDLLHAGAIAPPAGALLRAGTPYPLSA